MAAGRILTLSVTMMFFGAAWPAHAGPITLTTVANASLSPGFFDQDSLSGSLSSTTDLQLTSTAIGNYSPSNLTSSLDVYAYAFVRALSGGLAVGVDTLSDSKVSISAGGPVMSTSSTGFAQAGLNVSDELTIVGGPSSGSLALTFGISGSLLASASGATTFTNSAGVSGTFFVNTNTDPNYVLTASTGSFTGPGGSSGPTSATFPTTWTVVIPYSNSFANLLLHLDSLAVTSDACSAVSGTATCAELAAGSLGHTFNLGLIQVLDGTGQIIPDAYALGASGITYNNVAQSTVPEPSILALLATALAAASRRRRRQ